MDEKEKRWDDAMKGDINKSTQQKYIKFNELILVMGAPHTVSIIALSILHVHVSERDEKVNDPILISKATEF